MRTALVGAALMAALAAAPAIAQSATSYVVADISERALTAYDRNSLRWMESRPSVNVTTVLASPLPLGDNFVQVYEARYIFDCSTNTFTALATQLYSVDGRHLHEIDNGGETREYESGSAVEEISAFACRAQIRDHPDVIERRGDLIAIYLSTLNDIARGD